MSEPFLGEIRMFAGNYAPQGWYFCNGQILSITENEALYALLGTTYGGDGHSTFGLPDLRGRIPLHMGTNPRTGTNYSIGEASGTENVTLVADQLPAHTHPVFAQEDIGGTESNTPAESVWSATTINQFAKDPGNETMSAQAVKAAGGSQPHSNMMPYLAVSFIISAAGIYPSQS